MRWQDRLPPGPAAASAEAAVRGPVASTTRGRPRGALLAAALLALLVAVVVLRRRA